jgi:hypothetical protein
LKDPEHCRAFINKRSQNYRGAIYNILPIQSARKARARKKLLAKSVTNKRVQMFRPCENPESNVVLEEGKDSCNWEFFLSEDPVVPFLPKGPKY